MLHLLLFSILVVYGIEFAAEWRDKYRVQRVKFCVLGSLKNVCCSLKGYSSGSTLICASSWAVAAAVLDQKTRWMLVNQNYLLLKRRIGI